MNRISQVGDTNANNGGSASSGYGATELGASGTPGDTLVNLKSDSKIGGDQIESQLTFQNSLVTTSTYGSIIRNSESNNVLYTPPHMTFVGLTDTPANFGSDGQVLTVANGSLAWTTPQGDAGTSYFVVHNAIEHYWVGGNTDVKNLNSWSVQASDGIVAPTGNTWTVSEAGIYQVNINVHFDGRNGENQSAAYGTSIHFYINNVDTYKNVNNYDLPTSGSTTTSNVNVNDATHSLSFLHSFASGDITNIKAGRTKGIREARIRADSFTNWSVFKIA
jgi:hypothetical protein